ncbi:MAG: hypothetical protein JXQ75_00020, partial [Phycisphaerae bacterium]|nr:hypothetical protein [Phycisphaerae bacterium]
MSRLLPVSIAQGAFLPVKVLERASLGEPVDANGVIDTRSGCAGAWGYESAASFDPLAALGWLHVGERYY